jgi:hypothetical protein
MAATKSSIQSLLLGGKGNIYIPTNQIYSRKKLLSDKISGFSIEKSRTSVHQRSTWRHLARTRLFRTPRKGWSFPLKLERPVAL